MYPYLIFILTPQSIFVMNGNTKGKKWTGISLFVKWLTQKPWKLIKSYIKCYIKFQNRKQNLFIFLNLLVNYWPPILPRGSFAQLIIMEDKN